MVANAVRGGKISVAATGLETIGFIGTDLADFETASFTPSNSSINPIGDPLEVDYDLINQSSGLATGTDLHFNHRSIDVGVDITTQEVMNFFTNIDTTTGPLLHVIARDNKNGIVTYDVFFSYINATVGADNLTLNVATFELPPGGSFNLDIVETDSAPTSAVSVLREVRGLNRIYDVFYVNIT